MITASKKKLRVSLRKKRRSLTLAQQKDLSASIAHTLLQSPEFKNSKKIAVYLAQEMEVDLHLVIEQSWKADKTLYLPVLDKIKKRTMKFCMYRPNDLLTLNSVNILEPPDVANREIEPSQLDLVLLPLVAFDLLGHRLGRGGGYYDAAFRFRQQKECKKSPLLVGMAYEFQKVAKIQISETDINLDKCITEKKIYDFKYKKRAVC